MTFHQTEISIDHFDLKIRVASRDDLKMYVHSTEMFLAITHARNLIRSRLKYESISEYEIKFLEELQNELYVEGIGL